MADIDKINELISKREFEDALNLVDPAKNKAKSSQWI